MQSPDFLESLRHAHNHGMPVEGHERRLRWVVLLTLVMMVLELVVGYATNSMALTADGWHMATHAGALGVAAFAYWFARKKSADKAFSFGTGKVHALAGYTSAVALAVVAVLMIFESVWRLWRPEPVDFFDALPVAVLGLVVNVASAALLHHEEPQRSEAGGGQDHNLRAAYMHVITDAFTSVLAIIALLGGHFFGWAGLDASMGIIGGLLIAKWSYDLSLQAAKQLLDVVPSVGLVREIRERIEGQFEGVEIVDLHLWDIGPQARACILSLAATEPLSPQTYRAALDSVADLQHVTVEVHVMPGAGARAQEPA